MAAVLILGSMVIGCGLLLFTFCYPETVFSLTKRFAKFVAKGVMFVAKFVAKGVRNVCSKRCTEDSIV